MCVHAGGMANGLKFGRVNSYGTQISPCIDKWVQNKQGNLLYPPTQIHFLISRDCVKHHG